MYLGTGWSLILFFFPLAPLLTPATYHLPFVLPVEAATRFLTPMTKLMLVSSVVMIFGEWKTRYRWIALLVMAAIIAATALTIYGLFPHNKAMADGIKDPIQLQQTLSVWMKLNKVRIGIWTVQWLAMMSYFALKAQEAPASR